MALTTEIHYWRRTYGQPVIQEITIDTVTNLKVGFTYLEGPGDVELSLSQFLNETTAYEAQLKITEGMTRKAGQDYAALVGPLRTSAQAKLTSVPPLPLTAAEASVLLGLYPPGWPPP